MVAGISRLKCLKGSKEVVFIKANSVDSTQPNSYGVDEKLQDDRT